jgi:exonuclease SbcD
MQDAHGKVNFYLLPFVKPSMVRTIIGTDENGNNFSYNDTLHKLIEREIIEQSERNVLVSHQFYLPAATDPNTIERMDTEVCTVGNIDVVKADILERFDYAALGHIHKPMKVGCASYRYCGTPLACSVSEANQQKGIIMIEMKEKGNLTTAFLPLTPLRQVRVITGTLENVLKQGCNDFVTVILTDKVDLDVFDMQDRVRYAFPNLLEIRRKASRKGDYKAQFSAEGALDAFDLCKSFLVDLDEVEQELLRDVINIAQEVQA